MNGSPEVMWERDRYAIQRELGYRVYLVGYGGEGEKREEEKRERQKFLLQRWTEKDQGLERRQEICLPLLGKWELGVGRACLLKGQGIQVTGQVSRLQRQKTVVESDSLLIR